ncbi:MAG: mechanosensitive ion channel family protein [Candidatus Micrarchaeota archaeon]
METLTPVLTEQFSAFTDPAFYGSFVLAAAAFVVSFIALKAAKTIICSSLRKIADKTDNKLDDALVDILDHFGLLFYITISAYIASQFVELGELGSTAMYYLLLVSNTYYAIRASQRLIDFFTNELIKQRKKEGVDEDVSVIHLGNQILKYAVWVVAAPVLLANAGLDITPLLAGASIGGIAIAFALQNVLTDIFASFSIYFDKPFKVGDFITIGTDMGTVKRIGIKTTRLQTLQGEELVISNKQLTESRINNYKRMDKRRVVFSLGVIYQTDIKQLEKIPKIISKIVTDNKNAKIDRVHFKGFGESSLDFEVVYYVQSSDYNLYMDVQQQINLEIVRAFQKEKIEFAYPTRTMYMQK